MASYLGIENNISKANNYSIEAITNRYEMAQMFHERAQGLMEKANVKNKRYLKMIMFETGSYIKSYKLKGYLLPPVAFKAGIQMTVPSLFGSSDSFRYFFTDLLELKSSLLSQDSSFSV